MLDKTLKLVGEFFSVFFNLIYWLWRSLWRLNRAPVAALLPGQKRAVHTIVTYGVVMLEIVGLWVAASAWAATH